MNGEAKKLHLIEEILKIEKDAVLDEMESAIAHSKMQVAGSRNVKDFSGVWTEQEAEELKRIIEERSEQIHPDDWK